MNLDPTKLANMLIDPAFFTDCPAFAELQPLAERGAAKYRTAIARPRCRRCKALRHMAASVEQFKQMLLVADGKTLKTVRRYLERRLGRKADWFYVSVMRDKSVQLVKF